MFRNQHRWNPINRYALWCPERMTTNCKCLRWQEACNAWCSAGCSGTPLAVILMLCLRHDTLFDPRHGDVLTACSAACHTQAHTRTHASGRTRRNSHTRDASRRACTRARARARAMFHLLLLLTDGVLACCDPRRTCRAPVYPDAHEPA